MTVLTVRIMAYSIVVNNVSNCAEIQLSMAAVQVLYKTSTMQRTVEQIKHNKSIAH